MITFKDLFLYKTKIVDINNEKIGVENLFDFLMESENIYKMILATNMDLPVLTFIAKDLEEKFDENSLFPIVNTSYKDNRENRQNLGRIVKNIMNHYGYKVKNTGVRARIPVISKSKYFNTCSTYEKIKENSGIKFKIDIIEN